MTGAGQDVRDTRIGGESVCCLHIGADGLYLHFSEKEQFGNVCFLTVHRRCFVNGSDQAFFLYKK